MKKVIINLSLAIIISITQYIFFGIYYIKVELISNLITFLSIIFGFYITSLAIFATSKYVASLYKATDKNNKSLTLLHVLINNYRIGLIIILISIIYLLILQLVLTQISTNNIYLYNRIAIPLFWVVLVNFYYSYRMLSDLLKVVLQEAKRT